MKETKERKNKIIMFGGILVIIILGILNIYNYNEKVKLERNVITNGIASLNGLEEVFGFYVSNQGELSLNEKNMIKSYVKILSQDVQLGLNQTRYENLYDSNLVDSLQNVIKLNDKSKTTLVLKSLKDIKLSIREINNNKINNKSENKENYDKIVKNIKYLSSF